MVHQVDFQQDLGQTPSHIEFCLDMALTSPGQTVPEGRLPSGSRSCFFRLDPMRIRRIHHSHQFQQCYDLARIPEIESSVAIGDPYPYRVSRFREDNEEVFICPIISDRENKIKTFL